MKQLPLFGIRERLRNFLYQAILVVKCVVSRFRKPEPDEHEQI